MKKNTSAIRKPLADLQLKAKARQALKLAEIREALLAAGYRTTEEQAFVLRVSRSTAWALLNRDKRAGPSSVVLKRILSSPNLPPVVRRKVNEFIREKIAGRYGHGKARVRWFRDQFYASDEVAPPFPINGSDGRARGMIVELSVITCPHCGHAATQRMPTVACRIVYDCGGCGGRLKPLPNDCCVFCSYGSVVCPPVQVGTVRRNPTTSP